MAENVGGVDIATLGLRVDGREIVAATDALKGFTVAGTQAEKAAEKLGTTVKATSQQEARFLREIQQLEREYQAQKTARAASSAADAAAQGRAQAVAQVEALERTFQEEIARIKAAQARGFLSPSEAAEAGRQSARAFNQGVVSVLDANQGAVTGRGGRDTFVQLADQLKNVDDAGRRGSLGMHRLNNSLIVVARQATNTHPVVGQLADVVGTFAIGTAAMVPILAGIAALAFAWRAVTRDAREAKEEQERLLGVLEDIADRRRLESLGPGGEAGTAISAAQARMQEIEREVAQEFARAAERPELANNFRLRAERLKEEYAELARLVKAGEAEIAEGEQDAADERLSEIKRAEAERAQARREGVELNVRLLQIERDAEARRARERREEHEERLRLLRIEQDAEARRAKARREEHELRLKVQAVVEKREEEARKAQEEAAKAQEQATQKLVQALNNVGRAYGGVTDQVMQLIGAVLSLERMPMNNTRDRVTAYATAGATGVGIGQSTGNPFVGGIGGAASGFSLAGPVGAIVGGVSGIVSGLIEQGARARRAAEEWDEAMQRWERAYDDRAPFQQRMDQLDDEFRTLVRQTQEMFGRNVPVTDLEGLRAYIDMLRDGPSRVQDYADALERVADLYEQNAEALRELQAEEQRRFGEDLRVRLLRAQGLDDEAAALELALRHERELTEARKNGFDAATLAFLEQVQAQEKLAQARKDEIDAINSVIQALNSPSGLNLALYQWRAGILETRVTRDGGIASSGGTTQTRRGGDTYNVEINVTGSTDPRATARMVMDEFERQAKVGAGDPYAVESR